MENIIPFVVLIDIAVLMIFVQSARARNMINQWALDHNYQLLEVEFSFFKGPFFWRSTKDQWVYRITVQNENGEVRSGHIRCGGWFWGMFSSKTVVLWDGE